MVLTEQPPPLASSNTYLDSTLPTGIFAGSPQDSLDRVYTLHITHTNH